MATSIWECYGHGKVGTAIVQADSREKAGQACSEWLGWRIVVSFKAPERFTLWQNCGGSAQEPVVFAEDGEHYQRVEVRAW